MTTESVSPELLESTRKTAAQLESEILRRLAEFTQSRAASCMGVHASTVSRLVADDLSKLTHFLAAIGLQVAPVDALLINQDELYAVEQMAAKYLQAKIENRRVGATTR
jgi:predicted XRE-type DNA-binding protein